MVIIPKQNIIILKFRITRILTTRNSGQDILQDLNYIYDAVGNITR